MIITKVLEPEECHDIVKKLDEIGWNIPPEGHGLKQHGELNYTMDKRVEELGKYINTKMTNNLTVANTVYPQKVLYPRFAMTEVGGQCKPHSDNSTMGILRTDVQCTVYLTEDFDGGELRITDPFGPDTTVKAPIGHAVIVDVGQDHAVLPVTRGRRVASIAWIQSYIPDPVARSIMAQAKMLQETLVKFETDPNKLSKHYFDVSSLVNNLHRYFLRKNI